MTKSPNPPTLFLAYGVYRFFILSRSSDSLQKLCGPIKSEPGRRVSDRKECLRILHMYTAIPQHLSEWPPNQIFLDSHNLTNHSNACDIHMAQGTFISVCHAEGLRR